MTQITLAHTAGFCFGVKRAVKMAKESAKSGPCVTLGPIIHNKHVTDYLANLGVSVINTPEQAGQGTRVIIRSHGVGRTVLDILETAGAEVIDATCPDVKKIHRIIEASGQAGRQVVIIGKRDHPEVIGLSGWCDNAVVLQSAEEVESWILTEKIRESPITTVFQTTLDREKMNNCQKILKKWCTSVEIFDTICSATSKRQAEAADLAARCNKMLVIGDTSSANSQALFQICQAHCENTVFLTDAAGLSAHQFDQADHIGIVAGASTPHWIIKEVYNTMNDEILKPAEDNAEHPAVSDAQSPANAMPDEESFEALLEQSIKTLHTGEKVVGIVAAITPTEISVDLGTKQAGYIPMHELTDDPDLNVEDIVQVGAEVQCYVMRVNDVEGTVMLSKKRLDTVKYWDQIETALTEKTVVEGIVTEENKGGIVVRVKGIRVFVPASQTGIPKGEPMTALMREKVKLRITEVNQSRRRVVGSIRMVSSESRRAEADKTWAEIEIGKRYSGVVKSLTSYGAFVDIGGVDGMVHVSELSWKRVSNPSQVVKTGDPLEVYVISFDKEAGRISLGHKDQTANPWKVFTDKYEKDSVATVRIVKLMPFGAFAEIVPGVDGLIHISQIADRHIAKPEEFLSEGQEVDAKITEIDYEKKNVSLSIRALAEGTAAPAQQPEDTADAIVYDTDVNQPEPEEDPIIEPQAPEMADADAPVVESAALDALEAETVTE